MWATLLGALLFVCGMLFTAWAALGRRNLSKPSPPSQNGIDQGGARPTLEPERQGLRFLGLAQNWPGLALMAIGAVILLFV